jgi:hypothetical protein
MIAELEGKAYRSPISQIIGRALARIVDRTVNLSDTTRGVLRTKLLDGSARYKVEVSHKGADGNYSSNQPADQSQVGHFDPLAHFDSPSSDLNLPSSGSVGPLHSRSQPENQKDSDAPPKPEKQQTRNKSTGKPQPEGEEIDETWC